MILLWFIIYVISRLYIGHNDAWVQSGPLSTPFHSPPVTDKSTWNLLMKRTSRSRANAMLATRYIKFP